MTKTQLEIIDIIKDYMEKDLSEGCIIARYFWTHWGYDKISTKIFKEERFKFCNWTEYYPFSDDETLEKIIGHYGITSVLKYIIDNKYYFLNNPNSFDIRWKWILDWKEYNDIYYWFIPNKPLNLYTEEENLNLLKLLKCLQ